MTGGDKRSETNWDGKKKKEIVKTKEKKWLEEKWGWKRDNRGIEEK